MRSAPIHRRKDRPIERDIDGRRHYSAIEAAVSPAIAPATVTDDNPKTPTDSNAPHKT